MQLGSFKRLVWSFTKISWVWIFLWSEGERNKQPKIPFLKKSRLMCKNPGLDALDLLEPEPCENRNSTIPS
jgi:hypothetical protein